jgi:hypothetical protein
MTKKQKSIRVAAYVKIPGTQSYRARTEAEMEQAAQRALDRREANEVAKRVLADREKYLGPRPRPRVRVKKP